MKRFFITIFSIAFVIFVIISFDSCRCCKKNSTKETTENDQPYTEGVIKKLPNIIGSCGWVIQTNDRKQYETRDVPEEFFVDGLKIKFKFSLIEGLMSKCQTGPIIRVTEIKKL